MKLKDIKIRTPVIYWGFYDEETGEKDYPVKTEITSEPWELCGEIVCKVSGVSGGVSIKHLEKQEP